MSDKGFKYCVVEFLPDIGAGEKINVGIELHDMDKRILYKKYTKNVDEISRRYGYSPVLPIVFGGLNELPSAEQDKDYLNKKHERNCSTYERMFWSDVRGGIYDANTYLTPEDVLEHLYDIFVLIDKSWDTN
jgi:hypothetical protein